MSGLDSKHAFKSRAIEVGIKDEFVTKLKNGGIETFGSLAFSSDATPTSNTESKFKTAVEGLIGEAIDDSEMIPLRRLWFESHALVLSDIRSRTERTESDQPRKMPLAERLARIEKQKKELKGLVLDAASEPSHALVDKFQSMIEDGYITYIGPDKCMSREEEITKERKDSSIAVDNSGGLKLTKKSLELQCDVSGELRLRGAFTRRSLAMHQTQLIDFDVIEEWHQRLFAALIRSPPAGHKYVTIQQILTADRQLWMLVSQGTRGHLTQAVGGEYPLTEAFKKFYNSPEVLCFMTPLPSTRSEPYARPDSGGHQQQQAGRAKGKGKNKQAPQSGSNNHGTAPTIKELLSTMPDNYSQMESGCVFSSTVDCASIRRKASATLDCTSATTRVAQKSGRTSNSNTDFARRKSRRQPKRSPRISLWFSWNCVRVLQGCPMPCNKVDGKFLHLITKATVSKPRYIALSLISLRLLALIFLKR